MPKTDVQVPINVVPGRERRIGIMGGTFNPIHHGHLIAASGMLNVLSLDEIVFVPTSRQSYKRDRKMTLAKHRYPIAVIATASNPRFSISRVGTERGGTTYTIDTLRDLRKARPDADFFFITGTDMLPQIPEWKDSGDLWSMVHFMGVTRAGHQPDTTGLPPEGVTPMEVSTVAISSTDYRARMASGVQPWYLVPNGVVQYIAKYRFYKEV